MRTLLVLAVCMAATATAQPLRPAPDNLQPSREALTRRKVRYKLCPTCVQVDANIDTVHDRTLKLMLAEYERVLGEHRQRYETYLRGVADALHRAAMKASHNQYRDSAPTITLEQAIQERTRWLCKHVGTEPACLP